MVGAIGGGFHVAGEGAAIGSGNENLTTIVRTSTAQAVGQSAEAANFDNINVGDAMKKLGIGGGFSGIGSYVLPHLVQTTVAIHVAYDVAKEIYRFV